MLDAHMDVGVAESACLSVSLFSAVAFGHVTPTSNISMTRNYFPFIQFPFIHTHTPTHICIYE